MRWAWLALVVAGCSVETGEARQAVTVPDAATEMGADDGAEAGADVAPDAGPDAAEDAPIDSGHDSPDADSFSDACEAGPDVAQDAAIDAQEEPSCVPVYTVKDSKTVTADAGQAAVVVELECAPGETTGSGHWLGLCELSGDFATGCTCTHVGQTGVKCGAITSSTGTVTLTIWCERSCDQ